MGIGTLGEKTLHAYLKKYIEPDESRHEQKVGRFVADILREDGAIVEIQTRNYNKLCPKLEAFLKEHDVTVVFPMPAVKYLAWVDETTGSVTERRKSPKKYTLNDAFFELSMIRPYLTHERLSLRFISLEVTEYRNLDGWSKNKKKGSTRRNRVPEAILDDRTITDISALAGAIPDALHETFTVKEYAKAAKITEKRAQIAVKLLVSLHLLENIGKKGRAYLYRRAGI